MEKVSRRVDRVDPDDTSHCPVGPVCEACESANPEVVTASSAVGIICVTLCGDCLDEGQLAPLSVNAAVRRCLEHAGHLDCTVDDLGFNSR